MFSSFLPRIRHKASSSNNNTPTWPSVPHNADEDTVSDTIPWPIPEPNYRRRTSNDKNNSSGSGVTSSHHHQVGTTPPNWNITISNPIPRTTPNSLTGSGGNRRDERADTTERGGDVLSSNRSGRRNPIGVAESNSREWFEGGREREEGESQRSKRARRLYPPSAPTPPSSSVHAPTQTNNRSRNEAIQLARELGPPQVVRIDSGAFDEDEEGEGGEDQDENEDDDDVSLQTPLASRKKKTEMILLFATKSHRAMHMLIHILDRTMPPVLLLSSSSSRIVALHREMQSRSSNHHHQRQHIQADLTRCTSTIMAARADRATQRAGIKVKQKQSFITAHLQRMNSRVGMRDELNRGARRLRSREVQAHKDSSRLDTR